MFTIDRPVQAKFEVKKSKFISHIVHIEDFESTIDLAKLEHPKARHIIFAYRKLNEFDQIVENFSDDGEPKGSAGFPTLNVLRGSDLINTAIITIRYFGGTKLGVGGMVRAYTSSAKEAVLNTTLVKHEKRQKVEFKTPYSLNKRYEYFFDKLEVDYADRVFQIDDIEWTLHLTEDEFEKFEKFRSS